MGKNEVRTAAVVLALSIIFSAADLRADFQAPELSEGAARVVGVAVEPTSHTRYEEFVSALEVSGRMHAVRTTLDGSYVMIFAKYVDDQLYVGVEYGENEFLCFRDRDLDHRPDDFFMADAVIHEITAKNPYTELTRHWDALLNTCIIDAYGEPETEEQGGSSAKRVLMLVLAGALFGV